MSKKHKEISIADEFKKLKLCEKHMIRAMKQLINIHSEPGSSTFYTLADLIVKVSKHSRTLTLAEGKASDEGCSE